MYNVELAKKYWEKRIVDNPALNSVLYFAESTIMNYFYDQWEKATIGKDFSEMSGKKVLDLPVGIGRWTNDLVSKGASVDCVDISAEIIDVARQNVDVQYENQVSFVISNASNIGELNRQYDYILCTGLFEHLPKNVRNQCIRDFYKLLYDNGKLILVINNNCSMLIQGKTDNPYRVGRQYENGYYCELTDVVEVINEMKKVGFLISHYSINPAFSLVRQLSKEVKESSTLEVLLRKAVQIDIELFSNVEDYYNNFSDQIIIYGRKRV